MWLYGTWYDQYKQKIKRYVLSVKHNLSIIIPIQFFQFTWQSNVPVVVSKYAVMPPNSKMS